MTWRYIYDLKLLISFCLGRSDDIRKRRSNELNMLSWRLSSSYHITQRKLKRILSLRENKSAFIKAFLTLAYSAKLIQQFFEKTVIIFKFCTHFWQSDLKNSTLKLWLVKNYHSASLFNSLNSENCWLDWKIKNLDKQTQQQFIDGNVWILIKEIFMQDSGTVFAFTWNVIELLWLDNHSQDLERMR